MNLQAYSEMFLHGQINGAVLSDMNESTLTAWGIQVLHRKRLLTVINGSYPIRGFLEKDPYVKCVPRM